MILSLIDKDEKCLIYFAKNISYLEKCLFNDNRYENKYFYLKLL